MSNQNVETPIEFVRAVEKYCDITFKYDMAASLDNKKAPNFWDISADSLSISWPTNGWCWLNPPFRNLTKWVEKCDEESKKGAKIISIWPLSGDKNQIKTWKNAKVYVIHGRVWKEVRGCMLCVWTKRNSQLDPQIKGLSWDSKNLQDTW